ncbi:O-antigen ligase family protein [Oceanospirillaceae bacterium]|nr:O-antigen ligase family protein [Oceanospirillaceae bacterium]
MTKYIPILFFLPLAVEIFKISGKPVFITLSDFCFILIPIIILIGTKRIRNNVITIKSEMLIYTVFVSILVTISIGIIGSIRLGGDIVPFISSIRLMKNHVFFIIGIYLALNIKSEDLLIVGRRISLVFIIILVFSDVYWGEFPRPRLGGLFFNLEVYGFPNSPSVFFTVPFAFLVNGSICSKNKLFRLLYGSASIVLSVYIFATLSRAGIINWFLFILFMSISGSRGYKKQFIIIFSVMIIILSYISINFPELLTGLEAKFSKFDGNKDVSNGRFEIWTYAFDLFSQSPVFGLTFEPFSNYGRHDTPHNQYIEILFKAGFLGFIFYFLPIAYSLFKLIILNKKTLDDDVFEIRLIAIGVSIAMLITNNVQPNLSYTYSGVMMFFLLGFTLCKATQQKLEVENETNSPKHGKW